MTAFSRAAQEEIRDLARSGSLKQDMETVTESRQNPFIKAGQIDVDAFIAFVSEFNEFINHQPKPFQPIRDADMRL